MLIAGSRQYCDQYLTQPTTQTAKILGNEWGPFGKLNWGRAWLCSLAPDGLPIALLGTKFRPAREDVCPNGYQISAILATLGKRQIRQSPGLALNAHSGNE